MKAIISVIGMDKKGIIAQVSTALVGMNINIEDISQTILQGHFAMIMVVDLEQNNDTAAIAAKLDELSKQIGVEIKLQHESIFNAMHKI